MSFEFFLLYVYVSYVILFNIEGEFMEKNYYDILEINKNASPEIVEKAYKTLAKKYHPDLQEESAKTDSEIKMKKLNEAYEIISDPQKREAYNKELEKIEESKTNQSQAAHQTQIN